MAVKAKANQQSDSSVHLNTAFFVDPILQHEIIVQDWDHLSLSLSGLLCFLSKLLHLLLGQGGPSFINNPRIAKPQHLRKRLTRLSSFLPPTPHTTRDATTTTTISPAFFTSFLLRDPPPPLLHKTRKYRQNDREQTLPVQTGRLGRRKDR